MSGFSGISASRAFLRKNATPPTGVSTGSYLYTDNSGNLMAKDANSNTPINLSNITAGSGPSYQKLPVSYRPTDSQYNKIMLDGDYNGTEIFGSDPNQTLSELLANATPGDGLDGTMDSIADYDVGDRIALINTGSTSVRQGIYVISGLGNNAGTPWRFTRASDMTTDLATYEGITFDVIRGSEFAGTSFVVASGAPGDSVTFIQINKLSSSVPLPNNNNSVTVLGNNITIDPTKFTNIGTDAATGAVAIGGSGAGQNINIKTADDSSGAINIASGGGTSNSAAVNISTGTTTGAVTIGGAANTVNIKNTGTGIVNIASGTGSSSVNIGSGSVNGAVTIGGNSAGQTINIKDNSNVSGIVNIGTGNGAVDVNIGTGNTNGTVTIGGTTNTVDIKNIGTGAINIASGAGSAVTNIGTTSTAGAVNIGGTTNDINIKSIASSTGAINIGTGTNYVGSVNIGSNSIEQVVNIKGGTHINNGGVKINEDAGDARTYISSGTTSGRVFIGNPNTLSIAIATKNTEISPGVLEINSNNDYAITNIGTFETRGDVSIGGTSSNQSINIKSVSDAAGTVNIASGIGTSNTASVNIGSGTTNGAVNIGGANNTVILGNSLGGLVLSNAPITNIKSVVTKEYTDAVAQGFGPKLAVRGKFTDSQITDIFNDLPAFVGTGSGKYIEKTNLMTSFAALTVDGIVGLAVGDRVLFAKTDDANQHYGIYVITSLGSNLAAWRLTRATDCDNTPTIGEVTPGIYTFVREGATHARQGWSLISFGGTIDNSTTGLQTWSTVTQAGGGITTITPVVLGQTTANTSFVTDSGATVNTLTLDPRLFTNIGGSDTDLNIKNGALSGTINIGTNAGTTVVNIANAGTSGAVSIGGGAANTQSITIKGGTNGGNVSINDTAGAAVTNIGTGGTTGDVNIGSTDNNVIIRSDNNGIVTINNNTGAGAATIINGGDTTGAVTIGGTAANQSINIKSNITGSGSFGTVNIGSSLTTFAGGVINIANDAAATTANIGTGTTSGTVTIGGGSNAQNIVIEGGNSTGGKVAINNAAGVSVTDIGAGDTTGTVTIGGSGDQQINIKGNGSSSNGPVSGTVNIMSYIDNSATGLGRNINIARDSLNTAINIGIGTTTGAINIGGGGSGQSVTINGGVSGGGTVFINRNSNAITSIGAGTSSGAINIGGTASQVINIKGNDLLSSSNSPASGEINMMSFITDTTGTRIINIARDSGVTVTNIGTGTTTGSINIGGGSNAIIINPSTAGLSVNGKRITSVALPAAASDAVNRNYDTATALWKNFVAYRTTDSEGQSIMNGGTYTSNMLTATSGTSSLAFTVGASTIDGQTFSVGDRILVIDTFNNTNDFKQGIYTITQTTAPWILTRASDMNELIYDGINTTIRGITIPIRNGTLHARTYVTVVSGTGLASGNSIYNVLSPSSGGATISGTPVANSIAVFNNTTSIRSGVANPNEGNGPQITSLGQIIMPATNTLANIIYGNSVMTNFNNTASSSNVVAFGRNIIPNLNFGNITMTAFGKNILSAAAIGATSNNTVFGFNNLNAVGSTGGVTNHIVIGSNNIASTSAALVTDSIYIGNSLITNVGATASNNCIINARALDYGASAISGSTIIGNNTGGFANQVSGTVIVGNNTYNSTATTGANFANSIIIGNNTITRLTNILPFSNHCIVGETTIDFSNNVGSFPNSTFMGSASTFASNQNITQRNVMIGNNNTINWNANAGALLGNSTLIGNSVSFTHSAPVSGNNNQNVLIGNVVSLNTFSQANQNVLIGNNVSLSGQNGSVSTNGNVLIGTDITMTNSNALNNIVIGGVVGTGYANTSANTFTAINANRNIFTPTNNGFYINNLTLPPGGSPVTFVMNTSTGQIGPISSSRTMKNTIEPFENKYNSINVIKQLIPTTYNFNLDNTPSIGLIAEDTFPIIPEIVPTNSEGAPSSIRYDLLSVVLLDVVKKQQATIENLLARVTALESHFQA